MSSFAHKSDGQGNNWPTQDVSNQYPNLRNWELLQTLPKGFGHSWAGKILWKRPWQLTPVFLPGEFHGQRILLGYSPWGHKELDTTGTNTHRLSLCICRVNPISWARPSNCFIPSTVQLHNICYFCMTFAWKKGNHSNGSTATRASVIDFSFSEWLFVPLLP